jgi:CO/xanthine dehydrogenase FAD-binding subunit
MKAAPFDYVRPQDLDAVCAILASDEGARVIAGGQTLVPLMAMRLARPSLIVDIARIADLAFVREDADCVVIGATTRQYVAERHPRVAACVPLLAKALPWVGHAATRARGTIGGSLANADPAAEIALVAVTLDAMLTCRDATGSSDIPAAEFFMAPMVTGLPMGALLTAVRFPVWSEERIGVGFHEVSARRSDFAFASAAAQLTLDPDGVCRRLALGIGAVTDTPIRLEQAEQALVGTRLEPASVRAAVHDSMADIETASDVHASADYRRRAAATLATRAIGDARTMAEQARAA